MAMPLVLAGVDGPYGGLLAIPAPVSPRRSADRIPAGLVLPVVMAPAECEAVLRPNDLGAHAEARGFERLFDLTRMQTRMPDVCDRSRKKGPGFPPVCLVVVDD